MDAGCLGQLSDEPSTSAHAACLFCSQLKAASKDQLKVDKDSLTADEQQQTKTGLKFAACATVLLLRKRILSSASWHFEKVFSNRHGDWCRSCKVGTMLFQGVERDAAEHVLKYIYTHELPVDNGEDSHGTLLMWILKVGSEFKYYQMGCMIFNY